MQMFNGYLTCFPFFRTRISSSNLNTNILISNLDIIIRHFTKIRATFYDTRDSTLLNKFNVRWTAC